MSTVTAAADTVLEDGREVCVIRAHELKPGDTVVEFERIDLPVVEVRWFEKHGFVTACYSSTVGYDERTYAWLSFLTITPRSEESGH